MLKTWSVCCLVGIIRTSVHTFEKFLAGILLEECFMLHDRLVQVINHELEDRLDLPFRVASIVCQGSILGTSARAL